MKKLIALLVLLCGFMPLLWAADGCEQHLSREEFRTKQKAYIIEQAKLTKEEAAKFFPIYSPDLPADNSFLHLTQKPGFLTSSLTQVPFRLQYSSDIRITAPSLLLQKHHPLQ